MKYTKSAVPYLTLLFLVLVGLPIINHAAQKTQQVFVEVKIENPNHPQIVNLHKDTTDKEFLVMTLK